VDACVEARPGDLRARREPDRGSASFDTFVPLGENSRSSRVRETLLRGLAREPQVEGMVAVIGRGAHRSWRESLKGDIAGGALATKEPILEGEAEKEPMAGAVAEKESVAGAVPELKVAVAVKESAAGFMVE